MANRLLVTYNSISASLWSVVFFNAVFLGIAVGQPDLFNMSSTTLIAVQSLAVIEIINAATGIDRAPLFTSIVQMLSRLLIVYGIMFLLPNSPANFHWVYISLCLSWSITEITRYTYYAQHLQGEVWEWLTWLRYTTFYVLYPTGVASEVSMIILSLNEAEKVVGSWYRYGLIVILFTYIPGFYTLYTYMILQRKKILGKKPEKVAKKTE